MQQQTSRRFTRSFTAFAVLLCAASTASLSTATLVQADEGGSQGGGEGGGDNGIAAFFAPPEGIAGGGHLLGSAPDTSNVSLFTGELVAAVDLGVLSPAAGPTPSLTLSYSPSLTNGILGAGWGFGFSSSISRRSPTGGVPLPSEESHDGGASEPDAPDQFFVDGAQLLEQADGTFRTERDAFTIYTPVRAAGAGVTRIMGWQVLSPGGLTRTYGTPEDDDLCRDNIEYGRGSVAACTMPLRWHLSEMQDVYGNRLTMSYRQATHDGELSKLLVPAKIRYGIQADGRAHEVRFEYESRDDVRVSRADGVARIVSERIAAVVTGTSVTQASSAHLCRSVATNLPTEMPLGMRRACSKRLSRWG